MTKIVLTAADKASAETVGILMKSVEGIEGGWLSGVIVYGVPTAMSPERAMKMIDDIENLVRREYPEVLGLQ